jgi:hypothetical protein
MTAREPALAADAGTPSVLPLTDPMERLIASALDKAGVAYKTDMGGGNPAGLDFYLPWIDVHIEVKQFHSPRISEQMSRADNVIVAQGAVAVRLLAQMIAAGSLGDGASSRPL